MYVHQHINLGTNTKMYIIEYLVMLYVFCQQHIWEPASELFVWMNEWKIKSDYMGFDKPGFYKKLLFKLFQGKKYSNFLNKKRSQTMTWKSYMNVNVGLFSYPDLLASLLKHLIRKRSAKWSPRISIITIVTLILIVTIENKPIIIIY